MASGETTLEAGRDKSVPFLSKYAEQLLVDCSSEDAVRHGIRTYEFSLSDGFTQLRKLSLVKHSVSDLIEIR
jgi:hypothetical protein